MSYLEKKEQVIIRGYGDEPVCLRALSLQDDRIEVAGSDESKSICLPRSLIYKFTPDLFRKLREAYEREDKQALSRSWQEAHAYMFS